MLIRGYPTGITTVIEKSLVFVSTPFESVTLMQESPIARFVVRMESVEPAFVATVVVVGADYDAARSEHRQRSQQRKGSERECGAAYPRSQQH